MNATQTIENSYVYTGAGTYQHLAPVITPKGRAAGWKYWYSAGMNLNGVHFSEFTTLDDLLKAGLIELRLRSSTCV
jgi:hypothetical protein